MDGSTNSSFPDIHALDDYIHDRISPATSTNDPRMSCGEAFIRNIESMKKDVHDLNDEPRSGRPREIRMLVNVRFNISTSFPASRKRFTFREYAQSTPHLEKPLDSRFSGEIQMLVHFRFDSPASFPESVIREAINKILKYKISDSVFSVLDDADKFERPMRSNSSSSFDSDASFPYADSRSVPNLETPSPFDIVSEMLSIADYESSQLPSYGQEDFQSLSIPGNADRWSFSPEQIDQFERPMSSNSSSSSVRSSSSISQIQHHRGETKRGRGRPRILVPPHKDDPNKRKNREYHQTYWVQRENRVKTEVAQKYENLLKEMFKKVHCQEDRETMKRLLHENDIRL